MNHRTFRDKPLSTVLNSLNQDHIGVSDFFDHLFGDVKFNSIAPNYPPRNVIRVDENNFTVEFALAGWSPEEIEVTQEKNMLYVTGNRESSENIDNYVHKGISDKSFRSRYTLLQNLEVNRAEMKDGMLRIEITKIVPEEDKPRMIEISKS